MTIFRWAGSKRQVLPTLAAYWRPEFTRYVEPFAGSAALYFAIGPSRALLNDINGHLIEAYEVIRDRPDDLHAAVSKMPRGETHYYNVRRADPSGLTAFRRAVRFVYLNRHCFNGIYRTNSSGQFNVPFAHTRAGSVPGVTAFRQAAALLSGATLKSGDFGSILSRTKAGDFVYLDPPYAVEARRVFRQYDKRQFTSRDLDRLGEHLEAMNSRGVKFVVSYADCREARQIFAPWPTRRIQVRRNVSGFAGSRRIAVELVASNV